MKTMRIYILAIYLIAGAYSASARADMTCGEACKLDGLPAKPGMENQPDTSPPCMCMKEKPDTGNNEAPKEQPPPQQQPPPPPEKQGGDDECSQQGAGSGGGASCQSGADRSTAMGGGAVGGAGGMYLGGTGSGASGNGRGQNASNLSNALANKAVADMMNQTIGDCKKACDAEKQCRDQKIQQAQAQNNQGEVQQQQQKKQKADQNKNKCEGEQGKADQAGAQAAAMMQAAMQALQAAQAMEKNSNQGVKFEEVAPTKTCGNPEFFKATLECLCDPNYYANGNSRASPRDPRCQNIGGGELKFQTPGGSDIKTPDVKPLSNPFASNSPTQSSSGGTNGDAPVAGSAAAVGGRGGTEGQGPGAPLSTGSRGSNITIGAAPAGGGGGGSAYSSRATAALRDFANKVFGKKDFQNRGTSGMSVNRVDGITGPTGPSIWQKATKAFQSEENKGHWNKEAGMPTTRPPYELIKGALPPLPPTPPPAKGR